MAAAAAVVLGLSGQECGMQPGSVRGDAGGRRAKLIAPDAGGSGPTEASDNGVLDASDRDGGRAARSDSDTASGTRRVIRRPLLTFKRPDRLVRIVPSPPAAHVVVDGRDYGEYGSALAQGIKLSPGQHRVELRPRDSWYEALPFTIEVPSSSPDAGIWAVAKRLPFRAASVRISTAAPDATVTIPHRERGRANRLFRVAMNAREERVEMVVSADGFQSVVLEVVLRAGEEYSRNVVLDPTPQSSGMASSATTP